MSEKLIEGSQRENAPIVGRMPDGRLLWGCVDPEERPDADQLPAGVLVVQGDSLPIWREDGPWLTAHGAAVMADVEA